MGEKNTGKDEYKRGPHLYVDCSNLEKQVEDRDRKTVEAFAPFAPPNPLWAKVVSTVPRKAKEWVNRAV